MGYVTAPIRNNLRQMGDTLLMFQNMFSFGHSFWDTLIYMRNSNNNLYYDVENNDEQDAEKCIRIGSVDVEYLDANWSHICIFSGLV